MQNLKIYLSVKFQLSACRSSGENWEKPNPQESWWKGLCQWSRLTTWRWRPVWPGSTPQICKVCAWLYQIFFFFFCPVLLTHGCFFSKNKPDQLLSPASVVEVIESDPSFHVCVCVFVWAEAFDPWPWRKMGDSNSGIGIDSGITLIFGHFGIGIGIKSLRSAGIGIGIKVARNRNQPKNGINFKTINFYMPVPRIWLPSWLWYASWIYTGQVLKLPE